ncbi:hypothetical protein P43SY_003808 [Pythium insidiosum]|uniref:phytol kinase n=1 Tax=Pythium insidiosum TaxID=114742 RepID=A0AAD5MDD7_PYTIN|nr:hypothetical protein P43SY_003808 [Pythium insidiosum]
MPYHYPKIEVIMASAMGYSHMRAVSREDSAQEYLRLVHESNAAQELSKRGQLDEAERRYRKLLVEKPAAGFDDVAVALTKHHLGEVLRRRGKLDEAEALLKEALAVRERHDRAAKIAVALSDSNITRDELAKVYEARGDCALALATRVPGKRICGNGDCQQLDYSELHACSRCRCVFYCSKGCQRADWKARHRAVCQPADAAP